MAVVTQDGAGMDHVMAGEMNELRQAVGALQNEVKNLAKKFDVHQESTEREQRTVHDIVVATNESIRNLTRVVDEMKPLTDDYREKRAEQRGEEKYKNWLYGMAASVGGLIVVILSKVWDAIVSRPHIPILIFVAAMFWAGVAFAS